MNRLLLTAACLALLSPGVALGSPVRTLHRSPDAVRTVSRPFAQTWSYRRGDGGAARTLASRRGAALWGAGELTGGRALLAVGT